MSKRRKQKTGGSIPRHGSNPALAELRKRRSYSPALAHENLGLLLEYANRLPEAIVQYRAALALDPTLTDVRIDLGRCYTATGDLGRAGVEYDIALHSPPSQVSIRGIQKLIPISFKMWSYDRDRFSWSLALSWAEELVRRDPQSAEAHFQLANVLRHAGRIVEATRELEAALALDPHLIRAWATLGQCHLQLGDPARASECHEAALRIPPVSPLDRAVRGETLLLVGRVAEGWREHQAWDECCERERNIHPGERPLWHSPRWTGEPLAGPLLLQPRGGSGDVFQMLRYVPLIRARVGTLRLRVRPLLVDFIAGQPWDIEVQSMADEPGEFEAWTHTGPLPDLLGSEPPDLPPAPYLCAPDDFPRLEGTFKVGLVWAGIRTYLNDEYRSTRLAEWAPVLEVPGVSFYSLQLGEAAGELEPFQASVTDLGPRLSDWTETAAALMQLDLVVSVDSAVAHLAGALGRSVWMCLPAAPDPRWMLQRADTPLYGSARLFRQPRVGDWASVFAQVATALRELVPASV